MMRITKSKLRQIVVEELSKSDKDEVAKIAKRELKKIIDDELEKALKSKDIKDEIGEISKKVIIFKFLSHLIYLQFKNPKNIVSNHLILLYGRPG